MARKVKFETFAQRLTKAYTRLRIPTLTFFLLALFFFSRTTLFTFLLGLPWLVVGFSLRLLSCGSLKKDEVLATEGIYAVVRHPLYIANTLIGIGFCFISRISHIFVAFGLLSLFLYLPTVWVEEMVLEKLFGEAYRKYAKDTPRFLPRGVPRNLFRPFSWTRVRKNYEPQGVLAQSMIALLMLVKGLW